MIKKIVAKSIVFIFSMVLFFGAGFFIGCNTLKVFKVEGYPDPCNDMYTTMDYNLKRGVKDNTMATLWMKRCQDKRDEIKNEKIKEAKLKKERRCKEWIYQGDELTEKDYKRYSYYLECIK